MDRSRSSEAGGVIYWIFIAVALFAALSMAVANIGRGGGTNMEELARLRATDIMQYAGAIQRGIRSMRINGIDESALCFHADQWGHTDYEFNPQCTDNDNRVFHAEGGGISFQAGQDDWYDNAPSPPDAEEWVISAHYEVTNVGTDSGGATVAANADLLVATGPLKQELCEALNSLLGFTPDTPPMVDASTYDTMAGDKFKGTFAPDASGRIGDFGRERCIAQDNGSGNPAFYFYYKVILAR